VNKIYADFFGEHKPARVNVPSAELHYNCLVEIEATAWIDEG
jgi:2-iminobutanoate/2-iminopropanoate deaminase